MDSALYVRVAVHAKNWEQIDASPALIRMIKYGMLLPWMGQPRLSVRREYPLSPEDHEFATQKMDRWTIQGHAEENTEAEVRRVGLVVSGFLVHGS
jgi:hypothetical protein